MSDLSDRLREVDVHLRALADGTVIEYEDETGTPLMTEGATLIGCVPKEIMDE